MVSAGRMDGKEVTGYFAPHERGVELSPGNMASFEMVPRPFRAISEIVLWRDRRQLLPWVRSACVGLLDRAPKAGRPLE